MEEDIPIPRIFRKQGSPSPFSKPMASSTPFTEKRPNTLPKSIDIHTQSSSPLPQEMPRNDTPIVKIGPKDSDLWFDGKEVEIFIKGVENIAKIKGESGRDIARQISFWTQDKDISYHIEGILRYKNGNWEQLKFDMKRRQE
ncbi:hypothetical protein O181_031282 [Austropuccinia psidii MF-1]|uniref:Uncharacterized protein n=1 Tax=Austropuccinia psidii MF-1 TaxID=1389203 RepID=A0A9Q3D0C3_9BASI|nr:hypothetical protein [Austropuccinia psidii MF-1]